MLKKVKTLACCALTTMIGCGGEPSPEYLSQRVLVQNELVPKTTKSLKWLAMGDSYSAGNGEYAKSTLCNRDSAIAYPFQAMKMINDIGGSTTISSISHVACSGAKILDVYRDQFPEIYTEKPDIVTMTIGGNDAGFGENVMKCMIDSCWQVEDMPGLVGMNWSAIETYLYNLYTQARTAMQRANPDSKLYILSYPVFFDPASQSAYPKNFGCIVGVSNGEARQMNAAAVRMGDSIAQAVRRANAYFTSIGHPELADIRFIDWRPPVAEELVPEAVGWFFGYILGWHKMNNAYDLNGLCADVNRPGTPLAMTPPLVSLLTDPNGRDETWHPTRLGYQVVARRLTSQILSDF